MLVVPNRAPAVAPSRARRRPTSRSRSTSPAQATDPDGDTLFFACCDSPRAARRRRVANGAGRSRVSFDPDDDFAGPATFAYTVDDQQGHTVAGAVTVDVLPPSNRPPVATDTTLTVEAGTPTNIDLAALVTDPDPGDTLTFTITGPAEGAVHAAPGGATVQATAPIDGADAHRLVPVHRHRRGRRSAGGTVSLTVTAPAAPPPQAQRDAATTNQGQAVTVAVLGNDIDPLGRGLTVTSVGATSAGSATTDGQQVTFTPNADFFGPTSFIYRVRDGANTAQRESEAQVDRHGDRPAVGAGHARRPREGNAQATVNWAAPPSNGAPIDDYELRIEGGETPSVGTATGYTWTGLTNGQPVPFSVRAHNSAGWGPWSGPSPAVTPDIEPGRPAAPTVQFADGALHRDVVAAGQRGQRDHELRPADRRRGVGDPAHRQRRRRSAGRA